MRSPFPGMNPFIEAQGLWDDFHNKLMGDMERLLSQTLPARYAVRLGERSYVEFVNPEEARQGEHLFKPDVGIKNTPHLRAPPWPYDDSMADKRKKDDADLQIICRNRRATHEYLISDSLECGIVLTGTEVKSLRDGLGNLEDAYAKIEDGEVWLIGSDIPEYAMGNRLNHKPKRPRKLLLHKGEIGKFAGKASQQGFTLIPLRMYFKNGRAKVEIAVARGKKLHDKREATKKSEAAKEIRKAMKPR